MSVLIGKILSTHGLNGNVKLESFFENPEDIFQYNLLDKNNKELKCHKVGKTSSPSIFLAKFDGINSIDEAKEYRNFEIFIKKEDLKTLEEDQFYIEELIGMKVISENKKGIVENFYNYGAGDSIEVRWENNKIESIPFNNNYIKEIKDESIYVELPTYI